MNSRFARSTLRWKELNSVQDDIVIVDSEIIARPTTGTMTMWMLVGEVQSAVIAVAVTMVLRKR